MKVLALLPLLGVLALVMPRVAVELEEGGAAGGPVQLGGMTDEAGRPVEGSAARPIPEGACPAGGESGRGSLA